MAQSGALPPGTRGSDEVPGAVAADPLSAAEAKLDAGDFAGARRLLEVYVSAHPADARGLFDLGYAADGSGDTGTAEASYRRAVAADPKQFEAHSALGLLLAREGKTSEAAAELEKTSELTPNPANPAAQAQANRALARLLVRQNKPGDAERARRALIAALGQSQESAADTLLAAEIAARLGEVDAAADAYGKVLAGSPAGSPEAAESSAGLAHLLIGAKRYGDAEPVLRKALTADPASPALNTELAEVLNAEAKPADAIAVLENVHAARTDDPAIAAMLADLYRQTGQAAKAEPLLAEALKASPHDPALLADQGDALVREGRSEEAIPVLKEATRLDPANGNAWSSLAFAANQAHQPQLVLDALAMRSKVMSETPATYFLTATAWDSLHATRRAVDAYRQFLAVAGTGFPDEVWQARHRLIALAK